MDTVEGSLSLSIGFLKRLGYLSEDLKYGGIVWSRFEETIGNINFWIHRRDLYIRLIYKVTSYSTGEAKHMDYQVPFLRTWCYFGGYRYWFQCTYCQRRVGVLYINTYARCRKCSRLCYSSQKASRLERLIGADGYMWKLDEERQSMRITHYAGRPTKRYLRYLNRSEKSDRGFELMAFLL